jgi:hypothetical protein
VLLAAHPCRRVTSIQELESQLLYRLAIQHSAGARRPSSHSAQRSCTPYCDCRKALAPLLKSRISRPLTDGRKEKTCNTTRNLQGITYKQYNFLRNTARAQGGKKPQNPNYRDIRPKITNSNQK